MSSAEEPEIDQLLRELQEQAGELIPKCRFASSSRLYGELRRKGRIEHRAQPYIMGTFFQMDQAQYLLDFRTMRERAVELIALLEDEEQVRLIQPDFAKDQYEYLVYSMSSCAYENLAEATGQLEGYNSEGMHACIADGLQICRRTGKTGCVSCFREYACDVYLAADDPDIAGHQCRLVMDQDKSWSDRGDRRWLATGKLAWLDALHGRTDAALMLIEKALELTDSEGVSLKFEARLRTLLMRDTLRIAAGLAPLIREDAAFADFPSAEECPVFDHALALNTALLAAREGALEDATQLLTRWDQRLQKCHGTHLWFETRLRLIALKRSSGEVRQAEALARQLEQQARGANDYLTLRRLQQLTDADAAMLLPTATCPRRGAVHSSGSTSAEAAPVGTPGANEVSKDKDDEVSATATDVASEVNAPVENAAEQSPPVSSPFGEMLTDLRQRMNELMQNPSEEQFDQLRSDVLGVDPAGLGHPDDAAGILHLMGYLAGNGDDGPEVWQWANAITALHRENAVVLSLLGTLGDALRNSGNEAVSERITVERTEQLFRKSLELDPSRPRNFLRAGDHFAANENYGEAERCYARAFRLDRTDGNIVRRLSDLYRNTDRPADALHVLDLSLREGSEDPQVAFDAAMLSFQLKQFDSTLTYLDRYELQNGESLWPNYYRSVCYYERGEFEQALNAVNQEERIAESTGWHLELMRAATKARLQDLQGMQPHLEYVMQTPLRDVDFLSPTGLAELLQRLAAVAEEVLDDQRLVSRIESRLLRSGLMPDSWFQWIRESQDRKPEEKIRLYRCLVLQPLDESWQSDPDRLADQEDWNAYLTEWAVLAESEDAARQLAMEYQSRCHALPAEVQEVVAGDEEYTDIPGPVWQGGRYPVGDEELSESEGGAEDFDES